MEAGAIQVAGRDAELETLSQALASARGGTAGVVIIDAPAGMGRSTLALRAQSLARDVGMGVAIAHCDRRATDAAYACAEQLGVARPDDHSGPGASAVAVANRLLDAVSERGSCLIVDDAQWADTPSLEAFVHLARRAPDRPLLLVLTATTEAAVPASLVPLDELRALPDTTLLRLGPLGAEEVHAHAREVLGRDVGVEECAGWVALTGGNPSLLSGVLDAVRQCADVDLTSTVPERVRAAIGTRLSRLGDDATALARALHVLGDGSPLYRVLALAQLDREAGEAAANLLATAEICSSVNSPAFAVPLVGAAVGAGIDPFTLDRWHRRAAELVHADGAPAAQIAAHAMRTSPAGEPWIVGPMRAAAAEASAAGHLHEAVALLNRALAEPPAPADSPAVLAELSFAESRAGSADAPARIEAAMAVATSRDARLLLRREQTRLMWLSGRVPEAVAAAELAVAEAEPGSELHGQVQSELLAVASMHNLATIFERPALVALLDHALTGWVPESPALAATLATVLPFVLGDHRLVPPLVARARTEFLWRQDAPPFGMRPDFVIGSLWLADDLEQAVAIINEGLVIAEENADVVRLGLLHYWLGAIRYDAGDLAGAIEAAVAATDPRHGSFQTWLGHSAATMAHAYMDRGDLQRAEEAIAMADGRADPGQLAGIDADLARSRLDLREGRAAAARDLAVDVGVRLATLGHADGPTIVWRLLAAKATLQLGDEQAARRLIDEEISVARRTNARGRLGRALRAAAWAAPPEERLAYLEEACAVLTRTSRRLELARARAALGRELHRRDDVVAARAALAEARELAEDCTAEAVAGDALAALHATGARPRRTALTGPNALTRSERRVVALAIEGLTNREIGERLVLAPRTVEWHLGRAFAKLGVSSRRDLPAALGQRS